MEKNEFGERVRACQTKLYRISVSVMGSSADAEDAAAEAVLRAWEKRHTLRETRYFETWLTRILLNVCRENLRKRKAHPLCELSDGIPARESGESALFPALRRLEERYRLPLVMKYALNMPNRDIAKSLRITEGVVRWRLDKGRKLLKQELQREEGES